MPYGQCSLPRFCGFFTFYKIIAVKDRLLFPLSFRGASNEYNGWVWDQDAIMSRPPVFAVGVTLYGYWNGDIFRTILSLANLDNGGSKYRGIKDFPHPSSH